MDLPKLLPQFEELNDSSSKSVDLCYQNKSFGDADIKDIVYSIYSCHLGVQQLSLNLSQNQLGEEGAQCLGEGLSKLTQLQNLNLDLRNNCITDYGAGMLILSISTLSNLHSLQIELCQNKLCDIKLSFLCHSLKKLTQIKALTLKLTESGVDDYAAMNMGHGLRHLYNLESLTLNLYNNNIRQKGFRELSTRLIQLINLEHLSLNLIEKYSSGSSEIKNGLEMYGALKNLLSFSLYGYSKVTKRRGINKISKMIKRLVELNIY